MCVNWKKFIGVENNCMARLSNVCANFNHQSDWWKNSVWI